MYLFDKRPTFLTLTKNTFCVKVLKNTLTKNIDQILSVFSLKYTSRLCISQPLTQQGNAELKRELQYHPF